MNQKNQTHLPVEQFENHSEINASSYDQLKLGIAQLICMG